MDTAQSVAPSRSFRRPGPGRQPSTIGGPSITVVAGPILLAYLLCPLSPGKTTHCFHGRACARRMGSAISVERSEHAQTGLMVRHYGVWRSFEVWPRDYYSDIDFSHDPERPDRDVKWCWELNRFQHLLWLGASWRLTGEERFAVEARMQLESWLDSVQYPLGVTVVQQLGSGTSRSVIGAVSYLVLEQSGMGLSFSFSLNTLSLSARGSSGKRTHGSPHGGEPLVGRMFGSLLHCHAVSVVS